MWNTDWFHYPKSVESTMLQVSFMPALKTKTLADMKAKLDISEANICVWALTLCNYNL